MENAAKKPGRSRKGREGPGGGWQERQPFQPIGGWRGDAAKKLLLRLRSRFFVQLLR